MPASCKAATLSQPGVFATTRWSLILTAADTQVDTLLANEALAELCRTYWRPIFQFVCRRGHSPEEAQDLTQDFFVMILESDWLGRADEHRGRFRSFLLKSLQNFLGHAEERRRAAKRGGRLQFVSWEELNDERATRLFFAPEHLNSLPPEQLFDLGWAATVVEKALNRLREECESRGRLRLFETLSGYLTADRELSYAALALTLGLAESALRKQLHNLRTRYRWLLRDEVAQTVNEPSEIEPEIRHLCAVLAAASA